MLQAANQSLETDRVEGRLAERDIENVADGEEAYIEMVLYLFSPKWTFPLSFPLSFCLYFLMPPSFVFFQQFSVVSH